MGEGVRVNPNIVRIVMHIGNYGRSLSTVTTMYTSQQDRESKCIFPNCRQNNCLSIAGILGRPNVNNDNSCQ